MLTKSLLFCDSFSLCNTTVHREIPQSIVKSYLLKRGTTWNQLKQSETTSNHLNSPSRNYLKPPETTLNQPYTFLLKIGYSHVAFVQILHPKVLFGLIWSQKLKLSKETEILYKRRLLCPYLEFNVYFSKIFVIHFFWGKIVLKIWNSPNWLKYGAHVHCYMLITILMFIFSEILSGNLFPKSDVVPIDWNLAFAYIIDIICWL